MQHRKRYTPVEKASILRQHFIEKIKIREICQQHNLASSRFYQWRKQFFDNGHQAFIKQRIYSDSLESFRNFIIDLLQKGYSAQETYNELKQNDHFSSSYFTVTNFIKRHYHHFRFPVNRKEYFDGLWMFELLQGKISCSTLISELQAVDEGISLEDINFLVDCIYNEPIYHRNRAMTVLSYYKGIPLLTIAKTLFIKKETAEQQIHRYKQGGIAELCRLNYRGCTKKSEDPVYQKAVFSILHAPPSEYNINRTSWRLDDIYAVMEQKELPLSKHGIRQIITGEGYQFRKAKKVLTSTDPDYREKLQRIKNILSNLKPGEKFFSIDEYGPCAIKIHGGESWMRQGEVKTVPQWQYSKGSLIITGALELSTNQMTHFYSDRKNTEEMIMLLDILLDKYKSEKRIYLSWDAASWHVSKKLYEKVEKANSNLKSPIVELAPLPSCAQFLNVIESVFCGMAKAVIHNSDYASVEECQKAIDRHFADRNKYFQENPKRAGNKIWCKEITAAKFSEANNCKNPRYR